MGRLRFMGRDMVMIKFSDRNVVPGSTKYVDPGTSLPLQNQDLWLLTVFSALQSDREISQNLQTFFFFFFFCTNFAF